MKNYPQTWIILFFIKHFDTKKEAEEQGISIQMAARELRYSWFETLSQQQACDHILIAHNQDDVAETLMINQIRGCGIRGLTGIAEKNGKIVRPLLHLSRYEIEYWLKNNAYHWREDSSNDQTTYLRNKIRHDVLPEMAKIHPDVKAILYRNAERIQRSVAVFESLLERIKYDIFIQQNDHIVINIQHEAATMDLLYELLRDHGFNYNQIRDLYTSNGVGKTLQSQDYQLISDREKWILRKSKNLVRKQYIIKNKEFSIKNPVFLKSRVRDTLDISIDSDQEVAQIDADKIELPMILRRWKEGDKFIPLGMKGFQKLSDFFINRKLNMHEKQLQWILCCGEDIVWILGRQIDDRYKVTEKTKKVLEIRYYKKT